MPAPYYEESLRKMVVPVARMKEHRGDMPSTNLFAFLEEMREILDSVPAQHRASVEINLGQIEDHDGCKEGFVELYYTRDETPEELAQRSAERREWLVNRLNMVKDDARHYAEEARKVGIDASTLGVSLNPDLGSVTIS